MKERKGAVLVDVLIAGLILALVISVVSEGFYTLYLKALADENRTMNSLVRNCLIYLEKVCAENDSYYEKREVEIAGKRVEEELSCYPVRGSLVKGTVVIKDGEKTFKGETYVDKR